MGVSPRYHWYVAPTSSDCTLKVAGDPSATDALAGWLVIFTTGCFGAEDGAGGGEFGVSLVDGPPALQPANRACTIAHAAAFWYVVILKIDLPLASAAS